MHRKLLLNTYYPSNKSGRNESGVLGKWAKRPRAKLLRANRKLGETTRDEKDSRRNDTEPWIYSEPT